MKRFRDNNRKLNMKVSEVAKATLEEAKEYYRIGCIYLYHRDLEEYVLTDIEDDLAHFHSFSGKHIFAPVEMLGTFLPDVASDGNELMLVE